MNRYSQMLSKMKHSPAMERFSRLYGRREGELARQADKEHVVFADHEQYFYRDYLAYQPDYAEKIFKAAGYLRRLGYEFVFIEDTV